MQFTSAEQQLQAAVRVLRELRPPQFVAEFANLCAQILAAVGTRIKTDENNVPLVIGNTKITFTKFLELEMLLNRFTASQETYIEFWTNVSKRLAKVGKR